jgi:predicted nucleic acid-binding protein
VLSAIKARTFAKAIAVDYDVVKLPVLSSHADVTDAYLVELARAHGLQLATLDAALVAQTWALGIAFHPLTQATAQ